MSDLSSSVSETNRQRLALGLAPLAEAAHERRPAAPSAAALSAQAEAEERARVDEIRAELVRRKEKRLVAAKVSGQSLGESLVSQTAGSAKDWIERSRRLGLSEAAKAAAHVASVAAAEAAAIHEDAYTARDLAGTKIAHDFAEFDQGEQVILTLKDTRILTGVADGLNDDEDELLNQDLVDRERQKVINSRRKNLKSKSKSGADRADVYGEEEAELLSKYSDEKEKGGLRLGAAGGLSAAEIDFQSNSAIYQQDEARKEMNQLVYSLDDSIGGEKERKFQSDYKEVKFKRKKKVATGGVSAKASADMEVDSGNAADAAAAPAAFKKKGASSSAARRTKAPSSLLDFLPEPSPEERALDLASRSGPSARQSREDAEERLAKQAKDERYLKAIQAAEAQTQQRNQLDVIQLADEKSEAAAMPAGQIVPPPPKSAPPQAAFKVPPPPPRPAPAALPPPPGLFEEEEDDLLAASLARARRLAQQKKASRSNGEDDHAAAGGEDSVRALAERVKEEEKVRVKVEPGMDAATAASSSPAAAAPRLPPGMSLKSAPSNDGGIVFTATTEFVRGLDREAPAPRVKKEGTASVAPVAAAAVASSSHDGPAAMEIDGEEEKTSITLTKSGVLVEDAADEEMDGDQGASEDERDDEDEDSGDDGAADPAALTGVAAALRLYKSRGILKEGGNGRGTEPSSMAMVYGAEKYDAFGQEQSMKEQFRKISHAFHGIEPGLKKQETRLHRVQVQAQVQQALREQGGVAERVAEKQRQAGSAHVVLDKKLGAELAVTAGQAPAAGERGKKRKAKESGPFAEYGFGKGGYKKRHAAQQADAARKATLSAQGM